MPLTHDRPDHRDGASGVSDALPAGQEVYGHLLLWVQGAVRGVGWCQLLSTLRSSLIKIYTGTSKLRKKRPVTSTSLPQTTVGRNVPRPMTAYGAGLRGYPEIGLGKISDLLDS